MDSSTKFCRICGVHKAATSENFSFHSKTSDRFDIYCRPCKAAINKKYKKRARTAAEDLAPKRPRIADAFYEGAAVVLVYPRSYAIGADA